MSFADTVPFELDEEPTSDRSRRTRKILIWIFVPILSIAVVAIGAVFADIALRGYAEDTAREKIIESLPEKITGDVDVTIGGFSFITQYLAGSLEEVTVRSDELLVDGVPIAAIIKAEGVPPDLKGPVSQLAATISVSESSVNRFITIPGADGFSLTSGQVGYDGSFEVLGWKLGYAVAATVSNEGNTVYLKPSTVTLDAGAGIFDASAALSEVTNQPIPICVSTFLPEGITVKELQIEPGKALVRLTAAGFTIDESSISTMGTCQ